MTSKITKAVKIVIVDDSGLVLVRLEDLVKDVAPNAGIHAFNTAPEAYEWCLKNEPDLVITDFRMPGEYDGMELLRRLKAAEETKNVPVIVITGSEDAETKLKAYELDVDDFMQKPIDATWGRLRIRKELRLRQTLAERTEALEQMDQLRAIENEHENYKMMAEQVKAARTVAEAREAKDLFVAHVSHEFRTPLQSIVSTVETLSRRIDKLDVDENDKTTLYTPMRRLQADADQLLNQAAAVSDFVRAEHGNTPYRPQKVDLPLFLDNLIGHPLEMALAKGYKIVAQARQAEVTIDIMRLRQIISNLVSNAVKYTHSGEILVTLDVDCDTQNRSDKLLFTISDTGIGIPEDLLPKVFQPWSRGDSVVGARGMGLGLSIVQKWVKSMKGTIDLKSTVGKGTTVHVVIPLQEETETNRRDALVGDTTSGKLSTVPFPYRVLLVDDTKETREAMHDALEDAGAQVLDASGGELAVKLTIKHSFDVVFLDLQMPGMDGYEVARQIRARTHLKQRAEPVVIVAMSAYELDVGKSKACDASELFDMFIAKPITLAGLVDRVRPLMPKVPTLHALPPLTRVTA